MNVKGKSLGFVLTGSFFTLKKVIPKIKELKEKGAKIIPIMSFNCYNLNTRVGDSNDFIKQIHEITNKNIIHTIEEAEIIGKKKKTDIMIIAPCSGNTIAKLANNIADTPATIAAKSHLRNNKPLIIAPSTVDGLSGNAENIGKLLNRSNHYFVPFKQENPITKPRSICFDAEYIIKTIEYALDGEQISPILL